MVRPTKKKKVAEKKVAEKKISGDAKAVLSRAKAKTSRSKASSSKTTTPRVKNTKVSNSTLPKPPTGPSTEQGNPSDATDSHDATPSDSGVSIAAPPSLRVPPEHVLCHAPWFNDIVSGASELHLAVLQGSMETLERMLRTSPDIVDSVSLVLSILLVDAEMVQALLSCADKRYESLEKNDSSRTGSYSALEWAYLAQEPEIVRLVANAMEQRASCDDVNESGGAGESSGEDVMVISSADSESLQKSYELNGVLLEFSSTLPEALRLLCRAIGCSEGSFKTESSLGLLTAVRARSYSLSSKLLSANVDPNSYTKEGTCPLLEACRLGWVEGAQLLLNYGAKADSEDAQGVTPLIVTGMLPPDKGACHLARALMDALVDGIAKSDQDDKIGEYIEKYGKEDQKNVAHHVCKQGCPLLLEYLLECLGTDDEVWDALDSQGRSPLNEAEEREQKDARFSSTFKIWKRCKVLEQAYPPGVTGEVRNGGAGKGNGKVIHAANKSGVGPAPYAYLDHAVEGHSRHGGARIEWSGESLTHSLCGKGICSGRRSNKAKYECHSRCLCLAATCEHRNVQSGFSLNLEVWYTGPEKKWGVKTKVDIPKGAFVFEYAGEIVTGEELRKREEEVSEGKGSFYYFELDVKNASDKNYCVDASRSGNASRFLNHACDPWSNLEGVHVFTTHRDHKLPILAFFAKRDILKDEELTINYGPKGPMCKCACKAPNCKYANTESHYR